MIKFFDSPSYVTKSYGNRVEKFSSDYSDQYDSDAIDSDVEARLYGAVHHQQRISDSANNDSVSPNEEESRNDIFFCKRLRDDETFFKDDPIEAYSMKSTDQQNVPSQETLEQEKVSPKNTNYEFIEILSSDESNDSDSSVILVDDTVTNNKLKHSSNNVEFGNVNNLRKRTICEMNKFYMEDDYDSDEYRKEVRKMRSDKHLWDINYEDRVGSRGRRYYANNRKFCLNCKERGHLARHCPQPRKVPVCSMCGHRGHTAMRCPNPACSNCVSFNHLTSECQGNFQQLRCDECGMFGHFGDKCPNQWRKYSSTAEPDVEPKVEAISPNTRISCYNCGMNGSHFGFDCKSHRPYNMQFPSSPLMPTLSSKRSHYFNGDHRNKWHQSSALNGNASLTGFHSLPSTPLSHQPSTSRQNRHLRFDDNKSSSNYTVNETLAFRHSDNFINKIRNKHFNESRDNLINVSSNSLFIDSDLHSANRSANSATCAGLGYNNGRENLSQRERKRKRKKEKSEKTNKKRQRMKKRERLRAYLNDMNISLNHSNVSL